MIDLDHKIEKKNPDTGIKMRKIEDQERKDITKEIKKIEKSTKEGIEKMVHIHVLEAEAIGESVATVEIKTINIDPVCFIFDYCILFY